MGWSRHILGDTLMRLTCYRFAHWIMDRSISQRALAIRTFSYVRLRDISCRLRQHITIAARPADISSMTSGKNIPSFPASPSWYLQPRIYVSQSSLLPAMLYILQRYSPHTHARKRACIQAELVSESGTTVRMRGWSFSRQESCRQLTG